MLVQYSPQSPGRSSSTSAFASGDAVAAGSVMRGSLLHYNCVNETKKENISLFDIHQFDIYLLCGSCDLFFPTNFLHF